METGLWRNSYVNFYKTSPKNDAAEATSKTQVHTTTHHHHHHQPLPRQNNSMPSFKTTRIRECDEKSRVSISRASTNDGDQLSRSITIPSAGTTPRSVMTPLRLNSRSFSTISRDTWSISMGSDLKSSKLPPVAPWFYRPSLAAGEIKQSAGLGPYYSVTTGPMSGFWKLNGPPGQFVKSRRPL